MNPPIPLSPEFLQGLREAEATYQQLVEGIPAILYIEAIDDLAATLYTSPQIGSILGFTPRDWRDDPEMWRARLHEDDRARVLEERRRSIQTGGRFRAEYRLIASDGHEVWLRDEAELVRNEDGEPLFRRGVMLDITDQKQAEEKLRYSIGILRHTMDERRELLGRIEEAQEEERRRIAADIHDDSIQVIGAADLQVQALLRRSLDPDLREGVEAVHETLKLAVERLRRLLFELRPPALDVEGLAAAVRTSLSAADGGPRFVVEDQLDDEPPPETRAVLFRIAQEAIANARKHAGATEVLLTIAPDGGGVRMVVSDDGRGFDPDEAPAPAPGHIGLPTMMERAELAGGWCRVRSAPGEGTVVECWVPLPGLAGPAVSV